MESSRNENTQGCVNNQDDQDVRRTPSLIFLDIQGLPDIEEIDDVNAMLQEYYPEVDIPSAADDTRAPSLESAEGPVDDIPDDKTSQ